MMQAIKIMVFKELLLQSSEERQLHLVVKAEHPGCLMPDIWRNDAGNPVILKMFTGHNAITMTDRDIRVTLYGGGATYTCILPWACILAFFPEPGSAVAFTEPEPENRKLDAAIIKQAAHLLPRPEYSDNVVSIKDWKRK